jgi:hypothetical protein
MASFIARLREEEAKARAQADQAPADPWLFKLARVKGKTDPYGEPGIERITSAAICDILEIPPMERKKRIYQRINRVMRELHWSPVKVRDLRSVRSENVRGYMRQLRDRPQLLQPARQLAAPPADTDTSPEYLNKIVARLEIDSRWAMARALKALIAEREYLRANASSIEWQSRK